MAKVHMLILMGGGDIYVHLINDEVWEWLNSPLPKFPEGKYSVEDIGVPDAVANHPDREGPVTVSTGSPYNDRAMACPFNMFEGELNIDHFEITMKSMGEITQAITECGYEVGETYEGAAY